jgi:hypothetical protein
MDCDIPNVPVSVNIILQNHQSTTTGWWFFATPLKKIDQLG